jgi:hypothetical protein
MIDARRRVAEHAVHCAGRELFALWYLYHRLIVCFRTGSFTVGKSTKIISISSPIDKKDAERGGKMCFQRILSRLNKEK